MMMNMVRRRRRRKNVRKIIKSQERQIKNKNRKVRRERGKHSP
jgi:hypothetical protein